MKPIFLFFVLIVSLVACSRNVSISPSVHQKKVLSTIGMIQDLVKEIGKDKIDSEVLIYGEIDPHSYEMVKGDDEKLGSAELIFYNGLGLEHGASLAYYLKQSKKAFSIGDFLARKYPEEMIQREGLYDPHLWMDISLWAKAIPFLVEKLSEMDPENQSFFEANGKALYQKLQQEDEAILQLLQKIPSQRRYLVTSHDAFHYFAKRYLASAKEEIRVAAPEGLAPDGAISPLDIQRILYFLKGKQIHVVFPESNVSKASLEKIVKDSQKMGLSVQLAKEPLYGDAMPKTKTNQISYLQMHQHNAKIIYNYLCL